MEPRVAASLGSERGNGSPGGLPPLQLRQQLCFLRIMLLPSVQPIEFRHQRSGFALGVVAAQAAVKFHDRCAFFVGFPHGFGFQQVRRRGIAVTADPVGSHRYCEGP